jgi:hypothetical protein
MSQLQKSALYLLQRNYILHIDGATGVALWRRLFVQTLATGVNGASLLSGIEYHCNSSTERSSCIFMRIRDTAWLSV